MGTRSILACTFMAAYATTAGLATPDSAAAASRSRAELTHKAGTGGFGVLYTFTGGVDGAQPNAAPISDAAGNVYGTTETGGTGPCSGFTKGCGVVYKVTPAGQETVLHSFQSGTDGATPLGGLLADPAGDLFGQTTDGGSYTNCPGVGCGVVYEVNSAGSEHVLYAFGGRSDGALPYAGSLIGFGAALYGTTDAGGLGSYGYGTVFELDKQGETVLYRFTGGTDGAVPFYGVVKDPSGTLYGTTYSGGDLSCGARSQGCGVLFSLSGRTETVLHAFTGPDGKYPESGVVRDAAGNLYGTTNMGGAAKLGTIYKVDAKGNETVLRSFTGGPSDGRDPYGTIVLDGAGDIYGTTEYGGASSNCDLGCGTLYELSSDGHFRILHSFDYNTDGGYPLAGLYGDARHGVLYGTTHQGGTSNAGTVFAFSR